MLYYRGAFGVSTCESLCDCVLVQTHLFTSILLSKHLTVADVDGEPYELIACSEAVIEIVAKILWGRG